MDTKEAILRSARLRAKAAKIKEQQTNAVTALFHMGTTLSVGPPGEHCRLHCKRMDAKSLEVVDRDVPVTLCNISRQRLDTENLPDDHDFKTDPPCVALLEVADAKDVHWTLSGRVNRLADGQRPVFACRETEDYLLVLDLPPDADSFDTWCKRVMSAGADFAGAAEDECMFNDEDDEEALAEAMDTVHFKEEHEAEEEKKQITV